ncbi:MAG: GldG family protein [Deltaproteobacteria bacterium]|nr:GldG family protein [Deltaproteobacteria bacterium]
MGSRAPILGIAGLVFLAFGLIENWMTRLPQQGLFSFGWFSALHVAAGLVCVIWYFASGSGSLTEFLRRRSTRYGTNAVVYSIVFVVVVVMLNFIGTRYSKRWDLSAAGVNSLTDATRQVLDKLDTEVQILAFVGPQDKAFVREVSEIYGNYTTKVKWQIVDPQISPELAQKELIASIPTLKIKQADRSTTVGKIDEESITNGIHKVATTKQKTIYFVQGHGEPDVAQKQAPSGLGLFADTLTNQNYEVKPLITTDAGPIPDDAAVVVLSTGDRSHFPAELAKVKDFAKKGGSVLVLLEPQRDPELALLAGELGAKVGDDVILDQQVRLFEGVSLGMDAIVTQYGEHPSVKAMTERTLFSVSRSVGAPDKPPAGVSVTPLALTSPTSWAETDVTRVFSQGEAEMKSAEDIAGPVSVGVAGTDKASALGGADDKSFKFAVFGDTSFLTNQYLRQLYNDALGQSVIGWLAGDEELISIAPRVVRASRAFLGEQQARTVFYLSVLVLPELILLAGIAVWWRRSSL